MSDRIIEPTRRFEVVVQADGHVNRWDYALNQWTTILPPAPPAPWPPPPPPPPPVTAAQPLHVRNAAFRTPDGQVWKYRGFTAFKALTHWLNGEVDLLQRYADYTTSKGGNVWRIFMMWQNTGQKPTDPDYYDGVRDLTLWLNARGIWPHWVLFCDQVDGSPVLLTADAQEAHFRASIETLAGLPCLVEEVNERFKNANWPIDRWGPEDFAGVVAARSSWQDNEIPSAAGSVLDWSTVHTPRDDEWPRKVKALVDVTRLGVEGFDATFKPCIAGEPEKIDGARPSDYAAYMAVAELYGGGLIHGGFNSFDPRTITDLQNCVAPTTANEQAVVDAVAEVWAAGIAPEAAGEWSYTRGPFDSMAMEHRDEWALRTFGMIGGDRQIDVVVRPTAAWRFVPQGGWVLERQVGPVYVFRR